MELRLSVLLSACLLLGLVGPTGARKGRCPRKQSCDQCIRAGPECAWCNHPDVTGPRCNSEEKLVQAGCVGDLYNPRGGLLSVTDESRARADGAVQATVVRLTLRPGVVQSALLTLPRDRQTTREVTLESSPAPRHLNITFNHTGNPWVIQVRASALSAPRPPARPAGAGAPWSAAAARATLPTPGPAARGGAGPRGRPGGTGGAGSAPTSRRSARAGGRARRGSASARSRRTPPRGTRGTTASAATSTVRTPTAGCAGARAAAPVAAVCATRAGPTRPATAPRTTGRARDPTATSAATEAPAGAAGASARSPSEGSGVRLAPSPANPSFATGKNIVLVADSGTDARSRDVEAGAPLASGPRPGSCGWKPASQHLLRPNPMHTPYPFPSPLPPSLPPCFEGVRGRGKGKG